MSTSWTISPIATMSSQPHQFEVKAAGSKKGSKPIKGSIKHQIFASFIKKMKSILLRHKRSNMTTSSLSSSLFTHSIHIHFHMHIFFLAGDFCSSFTHTHMGEGYACIRWEVLYESWMYGGWRNNIWAIMISVYL